jgi:hypothetical protein
MQGAPLRALAGLLLSLAGLTRHLDPPQNAGVSLENWPPFGRHHRQGVVKLRGICEIAHAKLIQPFQRAGAPLFANHDLYTEFLGVHTKNRIIFSWRG